MNGSTAPSAQADGAHTEFTGAPTTEDDYPRLINQGSFLMYTNQMRSTSVANQFPTIPSIRSCNISIRDIDGQQLKRISMKNALDPEAFADRVSLMTSMHIDFEMLRGSVARAAELDEKHLLMSYNGDSIQNQHELEAAVNDFANGIRHSNDLEIRVVSSQGKRGRKATARALYVQKSVLQHSRSRSTSPSIRPRHSDARKFEAKRPQHDDANGGRSDLVKSKAIAAAAAAAAAANAKKEKEKEKERVSKKTSDGNPATPPRRRSPESPSPEPPSPEVPPVKYSDLPETNEKYNPDDDTSDVDDDYEGQMLDYTANQLNKAEAGIKAMRISMDEWRSAADTFGIPLKRLSEQSTSSQRFIPVSPQLGFHPEFGMMAHQFIAADVSHDQNFGPKRGSVQADHMGLGKTIQTECTFCLNLILVIEKYHGKLQPNQRPSLNADGLFKGRSPRIGATFLSAYSSGVEPWPRDWTKIMKDSVLLNATPTEWRPKMIILHDAGKKFCARYGGAKVGLYHELTVHDLVEMLPRPDWDNRTRSVYSFPSDLEDGSAGSQVTYTSPSLWPDHARATLTQPSPTSTRFFMVSTNKSWQTRVYDVVQASFQAIKELHSSIDKCQRREVNKIRTLKQQFRTKLDESYKKSRDGTQVNQATRMAHWRDHTGTQRSVKMVCDLFYAAWVLVDELHSAGSADTLTYSVIVEPFNIHIKDPALRPSFTAITGSAMANGIVTVLVFALKALRRDEAAWKQLPDQAVQLLQERSLKETMAVWKNFEKASRKGSKMSVAERIRQNPKMQALLDAFAQIIATYFIARDYQSVDAWGKKLNLLNCTFADGYKSIDFEDEYHQMLKDVESNIQAQVQQANADALEDWESKGGERSGLPKPKPQHPDRVDSSNYQKAKVLASFPNFINAIRKYQADNLSDSPLLGPETTWGDDLGKDNLKLDEILKSPPKILGSIIYKAIDDICKGSAKMEHILFMARKTSHETTKAPHPEADEPDILYQSKYCIASSVRLCKAIVYAKMAKTFGSEKIAWVGEGVDKEAEVLRWRKTYNTETNQLDDKVCFMVASLKMVCQSIDLVEGHVFEGVERRDFVDRMRTRRLESCGHPPNLLLQHH